jgi:hypothetical protein
LQNKKVIAVTPKIPYPYIKSTTTYMKKENEGDIAMTNINDITLVWKKEVFNVIKLLFNLSRSISMFITNFLILTIL